MESVIFFVVKQGFPQGNFFFWPKGIFLSGFAYISNRIDKIHYEMGSGEVIVGCAEKQDFTKLWSKQKNKWAPATLISLGCIVIAIVTLIVFHGNSRPCIIHQVVCPLILGISGAIAGIYAKKPLLTSVNLGLAFFLVPVYLFFFGNIF